MLECYLPLCYEFHAVPSIGTLHSTQVPWCNSSAKRMIFILGPWVTWYTSCVVHAHPKIAALDNSSKYTAGFVSSIDSIGWEYDWEQTFGVLSCDNLSFRPSVNLLNAIQWSLSSNLKRQIPRLEGTDGHCSTADFGWLNSILWERISWNKLE